MDKKTKTAEKSRQEDDALNRALLWVAGAVILEGLLMLVNRYFINFYTDEIAVAMGISKCLGVGRILFLVVAIAGAVWLWKARQGEKSKIPPVTVTLGALALWVLCMVVWYLQGSGVTLLFVVIPVTAVLALIYYLYQRECFVTVLTTAAGLFGLWLLRKGYAGPYALQIRVCLILVAVAALVLLAVLFRLKGKAGMMTLKGKEVRVLSKRANYLLLLATCIIVAVIAVAALVSVTLSYYLIFALIAWAFILIVYYTVQML